MTESVLEQPHADHPLGDFAGVLDFLIDPRGAARRLPHRWFWVIPVAVVAIVMIVTGVINLPFVQQAMASQPPPANVNPDQFQKQMQIGLSIQKYVMYLSPLLLMILSAFSALVVMASCVVVDVKPTFGELFNLMAGLSLIDGLKIIATTAVIHLKGEPSGLADLQPALGLDIFAPVGTGKLALAFLGYINVFQVWEIAMAILIFAAAYRVGKGRAAAAVVPLFALGLVFRLAGALFTRT